MRYVLTLWLIINGKPQHLDVATFRSRFACHAASRLSVPVRINRASMRSVRPRRIECRRVRAL
jgi:hypothetical protein